MKKFKIIAKMFNYGFYMYLTYTCYVCLVISEMNESNNSRKGRWKLRLIYYYFKYVHYLWGDKVSFESRLGLTANVYCKLEGNHYKLLKKKYN